MNTNTRAGFVCLCGVLILLLVASGSVAAEDQTSTNQTDEHGPEVAREPVEFTGLESGDQHIEVIFDETVHIWDYEYTVRDEDGTVVADPEISWVYSDFKSGRLWLDLGETDLSGDDLALVMEPDADARYQPSGDDERYRYSLTTTSAFVQHHFPEQSDTSVTEDSDVAILNVPGDEPTDVEYSISDGSGETVRTGSTGDTTFVSVADFSTIGSNGNYSISFENPGEQTTITVESIGSDNSPRVDDGDEPLPDYIQSRTVETVNDEVPLESGTTVTFAYDLGPSIGNVDVVLNSTAHTTEDMTVDQLTRIPEYPMETRHGSINPPEPSGEIVSVFNLYFDDGTEPVALRAPVFLGRGDYEREDLRMLHYDDGTWHDLNATVVEDEYWSGYHQVTLEGHANSTSLFAVVADE